MELVYSKFSPSLRSFTVMVGSDSTGGGPEDFNQLICPMTKKIVVEQFETIGVTGQYPDVVMTFWKIDSSEKVYYSEYPHFPDLEDEESFEYYYPGHEPTASESFKAACEQQRDKMYPEEKWWDD